MQPKTINRAASVLASLPHVAARIGQHRGAVTAAVVRRTAFTMADAMGEAETARQLAHDASQAGAAVAAVTLKSKLAGLLVEKREIRVGTLEESDLDELLAMRDRLRAEVAARDGRHGGEPEASTEGNRPVLRAN
jgi:hypothetical protein